MFSLCCGFDRLYYRTTVTFSLYGIVYLFHVVYIAQLLRLAMGYTWTSYNDRRFLFISRLIILMQIKKTTYLYFDFIRVQQICWKSYCIRTIYRQNSSWENVFKFFFYLHSLYFVDSLVSWQLSLSFSVVEMPVVNTKSFFMCCFILALCQFESVQFDVTVWSYVATKINRWSGRLLDIISHPYSELVGITHDPLTKALCKKNTVHKDIHILNWVKLSVSNMSSGSTYRILWLQIGGSQSHNKRWLHFNIIPL